MAKVIKIATKPKTFGVRDAYLDYAESVLVAHPELKGSRAYSLTNGVIKRVDGTVYTDYKIFRKIISLYYIKAGVRLINGYTLDLGSGLGDVFLLRQERNPLSKPRLNRGESFKLKKLLKEKGQEVTKDNWKVYYTDDEFIKTAWFRPSFVRNLEFYKFSPANGQPGKGFKQLMSRTVTSNPNMLILYPFLPYKRSA